MLPHLTYIRETPASALLHPPMATQQPAMGKSFSREQSTQQIDLNTVVVGGSPKSTNRSITGTRSSPPVVPQLSTSTTEILARLYSAQSNAPAYSASNHNAGLLSRPFTGEQSRSNDAQTERTSIVGEETQAVPILTTHSSQMAPPKSTIPLSVTGSLNKKILPSQVPVVSSTSNPPSTPSPASTPSTLSSRGKAVVARTPRRGRGASSSLSTRKALAQKSLASHNYPVGSAPDGTQPRTSGKGLGRGRPGIKRGPQLRTKKRKQIEGDDSDGEQVKIKKSLSDSESDSDDYTPQETETRSGRQVNRPSAYQPVIESPTSRSKAEGERPRKKQYRGKEHSALCELCMRGHGPQGNAIVFCDGCNHAWHQGCHNPPIANELITDAAKEWFCNGCSKANKPPEAPGPSNKEAPPTSEVWFPSAQQTPAQNSLVPLPTFSESEQRAYYTNLTQNDLINLLVKAHTLHPDLPLFKPKITPTTPQPRTGSASSTPAKATLSNYTTPRREPPARQRSPSSSPDPYDDADLLYPKIGHGVQLPPESEDMYIMLEGPDCRTYSHSLRADVRARLEAEGRGAGMVRVRA